MPKVMSYWLFFLCFGCTMSQNTPMIGIRLGSQHIQSRKSVYMHDRSGAYGTSNLKIQILTVEAIYQRAIGSKQFIRIHGGIQTYSEKGKSTFANPVFTEAGHGTFRNMGYFLAVGIGRSLAFDKFVFQYGLDFSFAFSFPSHSEATYDYEQLADSSFVRSVSRNYYPGVWGPGLGTFFGLQWNFAPHFYLGLEGRFLFSAIISNVETKRTTDTFDRQGNLVSHVIVGDNIRTVSFAAPSTLSPPAILFNYRF